jgi:glycosyltransferase involved in cell wall biosynthesis
LNYGLFMTVDEDDNYEKQKLSLIFKKAKEITIKKYPITKPAQICKMWWESSQEAYEKGYDFFLLLGDDIEISGNWYQEVKCLFKNIAEKNKTPFGIGCVSLKDITSPNFPTFPIVHRKHIELFGEIFPNDFVNQDADPYLHELYRRVRATEWTKKSYLENKRGGVTHGLNRVNKPLYEPMHVEWRDDMIKDNMNKLKEKYENLNSILTLDIVIPCFRIDEKCLNRILSIKKDSKVDHRFILVIDKNINDVSQEKINYLKNLEKLYQIRIRVNEENSGASFSRNRGAQESHSDWILYLDDDVMPDENIIVAYADAILANPDKDGFVGKSILPKQFKPSTEAVHMAQTSFFWTVADYFEKVPWGITANLLVRRNNKLKFDLDFPKTGGGEDIDYCLKIEKWPLVSVPQAVVVHPWWDDGSRLKMWKRFFKWAKGDGLLINKHPRHSLRTLPNIWEWTIAIAVSSPLLRTENLKYIPILWCAEFVNGTLWAYYHKDNCSYLTGVERLKIAFESNFPRNASELGHVACHISEGHLENLTKRFDWFCGLYPESLKYERNRANFHNAGFLGAILLFWKFFN